MARDSAEFAQQTGERAMQAATFGLTWAREFTEENFTQGKQTLDSFLRVSRKLTEDLEDQLCALRAHNTALTEQLFTNAMDFGQKLARAKELRHTMTPAERILWNALRANQLHGYHFRRQQVIAGFIVDFYCHAARLAVEVDGIAHHGHEEYDAERDQILAGHGVRVLRIANVDVERRLPDVVARIAANLSPNPSPGRGGEPERR